MSDNGDNGESAFDPYVVLGLGQKPSDDEVRAAFEKARSKYDPEEVAHLGADAQEHFAAKLRMAERAYQMLVGEIDTPTAGANDTRSGLHHAI